MESLLSYSRPFEEVYSIHFIDAQITEVFDDMMPSNFLAANVRAACTCHTTVCKMIAIQKDLFDLLVTLARDS